MAHFESKQVPVKKDALSLYLYLADFRNFGSVMPDQIKDWKATEETCSFTIPNMASIAMRYKDKLEAKRLSIVPEGGPLPFELICEFTGLSEKESNVKVSIDAKLNPLLSMMASKPLQNLVDLIAQQIEKKYN